MSPECKYAHTNAIESSSMILPEYAKYNAKSNDIWCMGICLFMMMFCDRAHDACSNVDWRFRNITRGTFMKKANPAENLRDMLRALKAHYMVTQECTSLLELFFIPEKQR